MTGLTLHHTLALVMVVVGMASFVLLLFVSAPYGRHERAGWGPHIPARLGWVLMESPTVILFLAIYFAGEDALGTVPLVLMGLWQLHYVHRTFIFPFRMRSRGRTMPLSIAALSFVFQLVNSGLNAWWIGHLGHYGTSWLWDPRFLVGVALFAIGMAINLYSDTILLSLRRTQDGSYQIPEGGLFRWISCPNYLGELIEWAGWALAAWSVSGLAFAIFAFCNLVPRALSHHRWYRAEFDDYPQHRKAIVPWVL